MRSVYKYLSLGVILVLVYFCFEPVIVHNLGWSNFQVSDLALEQVHQQRKKNEMDEVFKRAYYQNQSPGMSATLYKSNSLYWSNSIGYADIKQNKKINRNTKFRIGSVSKALTSGGLAVLLENGKLKETSKVYDFVGNTYDKVSDISIQQLASHTSGIRNCNTCFCFPIWEYYNNDSYDSVEEALQVFVKDDLLFSPGSAFYYSSYNYTLLSYIMEKAAATSFKKLMKEEVFIPLQMRNTSIEHSGDAATFYQMENNQYKVAYTVNNANKIAGGGYMSTSEDLAKYGGVLLSNEWIGNAVREKIFTPVSLTSGIPNKENYALGWRVDRTSQILDNGEAVKIIYHGGVAMGATAFLVLVPDYDISVAITMNTNMDKGVPVLAKIAYDLIKLTIHDDKAHSLE